ncbi:hypothetical protein Slin15195_G006910 [Septoria linicola]|uniref:Uncharacterized protein n=1 Tax=Septoria linicola TaxID=215465 RepID=A0A9Q9EF82_9PEZI|nr:hypothetical protein Slin14017_G006920 [Septoria linicola]USW47372.1 hypothetical protein Slin15195_G006910 [Septoria linicola]
MACEIARLKRQPEPAPHELSVPDLLQQYAPEHVMHEDIPGDGQQESTASKRAATPRHDMAKRACIETSERPGTLATPPDLQSFSGLEGGLDDPPFELRPAPDAANYTTEQWNDSYQAMMQFMNSMATKSSGDLLTAPTTSMSDQLQGSHNAPVVGHPHQQILDLVDWESSMAFFQNSVDPNILGPLYPAATSGTDEFAAFPASIG